MSHWNQRKRNLCKFIGYNKKCNQLDTRNAQSHCSGSIALGRIPDGNCSRRWRKTQKRIYYSQTGSNWFDLHWTLLALCFTHLLDYFHYDTDKINLTIYSKNNAKHQKNLVSFFGNDLYLRDKLFSCWIWKSWKYSRYPMNCRYRDCGNKFKIIGYSQKFHQPNIRNA